MSTPTTRLLTVEGAADTRTHVPLLERYRQRLPFAPGDPLVTLQEGSTPLLRAPVLSELVGATDEDLSFDDRDSAAFVPKSCVIDPAFTWGRGRPPHTPWDRTIIGAAQRSIFCRSSSAA